MAKKHIALYFGGMIAAVAMKELAASIRANGDTVSPIDATVAFNRETTPHFMFTEDVSDLDRKRITALYDGAETTESTDPEAPDAPIEVPEDWKHLPWTSLQALASRIAPNETIRNKRDATRVIADHLESLED